MWPACFQSARWRLAAACSPFWPRYFDQSPGDVVGHAPVPRVVHVYASWPLEVGCFTVNVLFPRDFATTVNVSMVVSVTST